MRIPIALLLTAVCAPAASVTFNQDIAPILYRNCVSCHRPGEAAPFSLIHYGDAAKKARLIGKVTDSHLMPPWKAEAVSYSYRDERRLTEAEISRIQQWVKAGA